MAGAATKRVTVNLPADLLEDASEVTGKGITETIVEGLSMITRHRAAAKLIALHGKLDLKLDVDLSRERYRRR